MKKVFKLILGFIGISLIATCVFVGGFMGDRVKHENVENPLEAIKEA